MSHDVENIVENVMEIFLELNRAIIPLEVVIEKLSNDFVIKEIEEAIEYAQERFQVDKVLDYPSNEWSSYAGYPLWHLLKLTPEEAANLQNLKPVDRALLRLLKNQNTAKRFGQMKSDDARVLLREQGFTNGETESLWIEDVVDNHYEYEDGKNIEWCRLIPENEKTEEYKKAEEEIQKEFDRKEAFRMYIADIHDLADLILKAVRAAPEGISKKDIIVQLFKAPTKYIEEAFEIAAEEKEILPVTLANGEEGYRINTHFDDEDW